MNNCTIIGIDLGDKKHAVVGLDDKANIVLKRWIPNTKADLEALFRRNREQKGSDLIATVNYHSKETWRQQTE